MLTLAQFDVDHPFLFCFFVWRLRCDVVWGSPASQDTQAGSKQQMYGIRFVITLTYFNMLFMLFFSAGATCHPRNMCETRLVMSYHPKTYSKSLLAALSSWKTRWGMWLWRSPRMRWSSSGILLRDQDGHKTSNIHIS